MSDVFVPNKKKLLWIDIAKGITIILLIIGHSYPPPGSLCKFIFLFHMPLFFFLAGYLFDFSKYSGNFTKLIASSAYRLLLPALITVLFFYDFNTSNYLDRIKMFLYASGKPIIDMNIDGIGYALWFVFCLFIVRILLWGFLTIVKNVRTSVFFHIIMAFLIAKCGIFLGQHIKMPWSFDIALVALYFAFAGYLIKEKGLLDRKRSTIIVFIISLISFVLSILFLRCGYLDYKYFALSLNERVYSLIPILSLNNAVVLSLFVIIGAKILEKINLSWINIFLQYLGVNTIIIMIAHCCVYTSGYFECTMLRLAFSIIFIEVLALIPYIKDIFGAKSIFTVRKFLKM